MPDWFVINPTRLPRTSADGCSMKISMPGRTAGADAHAKVAATSRAAVRVMSSVTCYALRPRLQPRATERLLHEFRRQLQRAEGRIDALGHEAPPFEGR